MTITKIPRGVFGCSSELRLSLSAGAEEVEHPAALLKCVQAFAGSTDF